MDYRYALLMAAAAAFALAARPAAGVEELSVRVVASPPSKGGSDHYIGNRSPLLASPLMKLPVGCVRPEGWVRTQLELLANGFIGRLPEISPWLKFETSAWVSPDGEGENGWEEMPYWLKGYTDLGYVLGDSRIVDEATRWVEGIISTRRSDGYFGPESNLKAMDLWPNMVALYALRTHYDATGDRRVLDLMTGYFGWMMKQPLENILPRSWQKTRGGDNLDSIYWLYNRTGEQRLLAAARVNHERTADWTGGVASWHGVNISQCFREPGQYYQQTKDIRYLRAAERNYDEVYRLFGQMPCGHIAADENCREGYTGPRQATETCTLVEFMYSHEMLAAITGDVKWADRCEDVAFNILPASMTPDLKGLHYLTAANMVQLDSANKAPMIQNGGEMLSYNPHAYRCCQHNVAFGWPYFVEHMWMATQGNGLAAVLYGPCKVTAVVGDSVTVSISEQTAYPFDETVSLTLSAPKPVSFPLALRIPGWCDSPTLAVNGKIAATPGSPKGWLLIERVWRDGDTVLLTLPMKLEVKTWELNRNAVSVYRGPLAYSLKIGERWHRYGGTEEWPAYEVYPTTPWNYGLELDGKDAEGSLEVVKARGRIADQPFTPDDAPLQIRAAGRKIPQWVLEENGLIGEVQQGPVRSTEPLEEITLIPMGCARLRVSMFPVIGGGPGAFEWGETDVTAAASHIGNSIAAIHDNIEPASSADASVPRFTWWDHRGTREWVQYDFKEPRRISCAEVYWFDDAPSGGLCRTPESWRLLWWDGKSWQPIDASYGVRTDAVNRVDFAAVETAKLRLEVQLRPGYSGGILEWRIGD